eukprot:scaffold195463_cov16-Tisochrysis_lutea.AAC.2
MPIWHACIHCALRINHALDQILQGDVSALPSQVLLLIPSSRLAACDQHMCACFKVQSVHDQVPRLSM